MTQPRKPSIPSATAREGKPLMWFWAAFSSSSPFLRSISDIGGRGSKKVMINLLFLEVADADHVRHC